MTDYATVRNKVETDDTLVFASGHETLDGSPRKITKEELDGIPDFILRWDDYIPVDAVRAWIEYHHEGQSEIHDQGLFISSASSDEYFAKVVYEYDESLNKLDDVLAFAIDWEVVAHELLREDYIKLEYNGSNYYFRSVA